jgi:hypothetical protein
MAATTMLDKPLNDLRREITDLQQANTSRDYDMNKLCSIITISRDSLKETEIFELSLADINQILRNNTEQKTQLKQQQEESGFFSFQMSLMLN